MFVVVVVVVVVGALLDVGPNHPAELAAHESKLAPRRRQGPPARAIIPAPAASLNSFRRHQHRWPPKNSI